MRAARGGGQVPAAELRASDDLQAARNGPWAAGAVDEGGSRGAGREEGAGGVGHSHGLGATQSAVHARTGGAPRGRSPEGSTRAYRRRRAGADEESGIRGL